MSISSTGPLVINYIDNENSSFSRYFHSLFRNNNDQNWNLLRENIRYTTANIGLDNLNQSLVMANSFREYHFDKEKSIKIEKCIKEIENLRNKLINKETIGDRRVASNNILKSLQ